MDARARAVSAVSAEIDLAVDAIRSKTSLTAKEERQRDQKFGVLWSPTEAPKDFERWTSDLGTGGGIAVIYCDLDLFKAINTKYTEPVVDEQFIPVALNIIDRYVLLRGYGYQEGGDEYVVILPNYEADEAVAFAEKIRGAFEQHIFVINQDEVPVTLSAGVALWPVHGRTYREVLEKAAEAKRAAKHKRNCVRLASIESNTDQPLPTSGLSPTAQRLAVLASNASVNGLLRDPILDPASLGKILSISQEDLALAADELQERGWTGDRATMPVGKAGFSSLWPTEKFFIETDAYIKGWNPKSDAKIVAQELLKTSQQTTRLSRLDEILKWGPRRLNPAVYFLIIRDIVKFSKTMNALPYCYEQIWGTPRTARFASEEQ
jgi:diguanylate cyclase (GGDEF)-like protein